MLKNIFQLNCVNDGQEEVTEGIFVAGPLVRSCSRLAAAVYRAVGELWCLLLWPVQATTGGRLQPQKAAHL